MADQFSEMPAIACTLSAQDFKARLDSIAQLNSAALLSHHREDLRLELIYDAKARARVLEMVAGEEACCAFLAFEVRDARDTVQVIICAPESARTAAETVFEPFRSKASAKAGCACCGTATPAAFPTRRSEPPAGGGVAADHERTLSRKHSRDSVRRSMSRLVFIYSSPRFHTRARYHWT